VKIQVEFNPANVQAYRLLGYEDRMLEAKDFNDDKKDAGEIGAGHSVTALYEIVPANILDESLGSVDSLKYQTLSPSAEAYASGELMHVKLRYKDPKDTISKLIATTVAAKDVRPFDSASTNLRFASAVSEFGMIVRNSDEKGTSSLAHVSLAADAARGADASGYRAEFSRLVKLYGLLDLRAEK
jgi:Ca-activated chloride channel family protein